MKILISGAAGFIASNVANYLSKKHLVIGVDDLSFGNLENVNENISLHVSKFQDIDDTMLNQFDVLIHCACANIIYAQTNQEDTIKTNAVDSIELFKRFKGKIIYTSTASVYGMADSFPIKEDAPKRIYNAYDSSKLTAEIYLRERGNFTTLRLSNVYGANQRPDNPYCGVIGRFIGDIKDKGYVNIYGTGEQTRDYTNVKDVVSAIELALNQPAINTEVNIGTGIETSVLELALMLLNMIAINTKIHKVKKRGIDKITRRSVDISKAFELLGWKPKINLADGLHELI